MVVTERKLREGVANEALNKLRLHLTTYQALELRRKNVSGVIQNTEVDRRLSEKRLATDRAKHDYRENRYLLRVLGMPEDDATFKPLEDRHCYAFAITAAEHRIGDSHRLPSWIWGDFSYVAEVQGPDIRKFLDDSECFVMLRLVTLLTSVQVSKRTGSDTAHLCGDGQKQCTRDARRCSER